MGVTLAALIAGCLWAGAPAQAQQVTATDADVAKPVSDVNKADTADVAKESQNPIGNLIIMQFQNNTNFGFGPSGGTQNVLLFQPVVPFHLNSDWNLIVRAVIPGVWNPSLAPAPSVPFAIAPTTFSAFFSPSHPANGWTWGVGPAFQIPTVTDPSVGSNIWGLGPTAVIVKTEGPIVAGLLANNLFSAGGTSGPRGTRYATLLLQPFFNYNFQAGWFVSTGPLITANEYALGQNGPCPPAQWPAV